MRIRKKSGRRGILQCKYFFIVGIVVLLVLVVVVWYKSIMLEEIDLSSPLDIMDLPRMAKKKNNNNKPVVGTTPGKTATDVSVNNHHLPLETRNS